MNFPATWTNIRPPTAITPDASAAVGDAYIGNDVYQSWVWRHSQLADLGIPDGMHSITATAIRGDGDLVTGTALREIRPNSYELRPFIWTPSSGWLTIDAWFESEGLSFPGWTFRSVLFVSPDGQTFAGEGITPAGERHGYVITIPAPGAALVLATTLVYGASRRRPKHPWKTTSRPMRGA